MSILHVERLGGLANFGGANSRVRSQGQIDSATLSTADQHALDALFQKTVKTKASATRDGFHYRISRITSSGTETVEATETAVPTAITQCVTDELI